MYKVVGIVAEIKKKRMVRVEYPVKMYHERVVNNIFESKQKGRRTGGPRSKLLEDIGKDLQMIKVKIWRHKTVDREGWASVIREAKVFRGL